MPLEIQIAFIRNCVEILGPSYREEVQMRETLAKWIEREE
jgi:hypothetical protein